MTRTLLIIGASGIIGRAVIRHFAGRENIRLIAASRQPDAKLPSNAAPLPVDLFSDAPFPETEATHALFCAFADAPGFAAQQEPNRRLFDGALRLMERSPNLEQATLIQGMKAYGSNLGPFRTPARESDARIPQGHFYDDQYDALATAAAKNGWRHSALRPHVVIGPALRSPQNLAAVIGVYATLKRTKGEPLDFPGSEIAFGTVTQATDAGLLAKAVEWASDAPTADGEIFNITNGDFYRWRNIWPRIAALFDMPAGEVTGVPPSKKMADGAPLWRDLAARHNLIEGDLASLVSWPFADYIFGVEWDVMADTQKARRAGFPEFMDSEDMLLHRLAELRDLKIIP